MDVLKRTKLANRQRTAERGRDKREQLIVESEEESSADGWGRRRQSGIMRFLSYLIWAALLIEQVRRKKTKPSLFFFWVGYSRGLATLPSLFDF